MLELLRVLLGGVDADSPTSFMFGLTAVAGKYTVSDPISVLVKDKDAGTDAVYAIADVNGTGFGG